MLNKKNNIILILVLCISLIQSVKAQEKDAIINDVTVNGQKQIQISWGELHFTYDIASSYDWNASTHKYDESSNGTWISKGNKIGITNKSIIPVDVDFEYTNTSQENINFSFSKNHLHLRKNQGENIIVYPSGSPKNKTNIFKKIGVVTAVIT